MSIVKVKVEKQFFFVLVGIGGGAGCDLHHFPSIPEEILILSFKIHYFIMLKSTLWGLDTIRVDSVSIWVLQPTGSLIYQSFLPKPGKETRKKEKIPEVCMSALLRGLFSFPIPSHPPFFFILLKKKKPTKSLVIMASPAVHHSPVQKGLYYYIICTLNGIHC